MMFSNRSCLPLIRLVGFPLKAISAKASKLRVPFSKAAPDPVSKEAYRSFRKELKEEWVKIFSAVNKALAKVSAPPIWA